MAIEVKKVVAEGKPVAVLDEDKKPVYCQCCIDHKVNKMAMIRGSAFELRTLLQPWFSSLGAKEIISHAQSESDGNLSVSVTYR